MKDYIFKINLSHSKNRHTLFVRDEKEEIACKMLLSSGYLGVDVGLKGCTTKSFNANVSQTKDHTHTPMHIIQSTAIIFPSVVMLSPLPVGEARDTLDNTQENHTHTHTHYRSKGQVSHQFTHPPNACFGEEARVLGESPHTHTHTRGKNANSTEKPLTPQTVWLRGYSADPCTTVPPDTHTYQICF